MPHTDFSWVDPATWIPAALAGGFGIYKIARMLMKDRRDDKNEQQVDEATRQIITTLREEVRRLTERVGDMEKEIMRLHDERKAYIAENAALLANLAECEGVAANPRLF